MRMKHSHFQAEISKLALEGVKQRDIAAKLGIGLGTVSRMFCKAREEWMAESKQANDERVAIVAARLESLYQEAIAKFKDSGRVFWHEAARKALADYRKLFGTDAPVRTEISGAFESATIYEQIVTKRTDVDAIAPRAGDIPGLPG